MVLWDLLRRSRRSNTGFYLKIKSPTIMGGGNHSTPPWLKKTCQILPRLENGPTPPLDPTPWGDANSGNGLWTMDRNIRGDNHLWPTTRKYTVRYVLFNVLQPNPRGSSMACTGTWISTHATKARPLISDTSDNRRNFLRPLRCYSTTWWKHRSTTTCHGATHSLRPT